MPWILDVMRAIDRAHARSHAVVSEEILQLFFADGTHHVVLADAVLAPVVTARLERSTRSFTAGQRVLVHDLDERASVIGRYRRAHRWIHGVCPIDALIDGRPYLVREPAALRLLEGAWIPAGLFRGRFWPMPAVAVRP